MSLPTFTSHTTAEFAAESLSGIIKSKNVLITGTTVGGIGLEAARTIAKAGAGLVIITGYNTERLRAAEEAIKAEAPTATIRALVLDLSSLDSVREAAATVNSYSEPLHVLIHNAAMTGRSSDAATATGLDLQFAIDHIGPFLLTKLLLPKLLASQATSSDFTPRVVVVSSRIHSMIPPSENAGELHPLGDFSKIAFRVDTNEKLEPRAIHARYAQGKSANILFAKELAKRIGKRLNVYCLHPGLVYTSAISHPITTTAMKATGALSTEGKPNEDYSVKWKTVGEGAATIVVAAFDPRLDDMSGTYLVDCVPADEAVSPHCLHQGNAAILWTRTEEIIGEKFEL
ncbi:hypothetical protein DFH07DRAFT_841353 [Mycena maculata]|uniref:Short-chain dehydrogenase n=1 Tax=Mycena maculata TaxID=230809 RepID=A0AAD7I9E9_9AGAR|nr:hypothetical protein DFH07DRAFT_841353 [Mycena maculata]